MVDQVQIKTITIQDVIEREEEDKLIEISEGQWDEEETLGVAGGDHGEIEMEIAGEMRNYAKANNLGRVYPGDTDFILEGVPGNIILMRKPDVAFVAADRVQDKIGGYYYLAPDLAVEIISPSDRPGKVARKLGEYLRAGVKQVWLVYPESQEVIVHSGGGVTVYGINDTLHGGDELPGFSLPLKTIFG